MNKKKKQPKTQYEVYQEIRRDWGEVNPVTKIIPNKKKYKRKEKHVKRNEETSSTNL